MGYSTYDDSDLKSRAGKPIEKLCQKRESNRPEQGRYSSTTFNGWLPSDKVNKVFKLAAARTAGKPAAGQKERRVEERFFPA